MKKKNGRFNCDQCGFKSVDLNNLMEHKRNKHESRWYDCDHCNYKTTNTGNLTAHMQAKHEGGVIKNNAGFMILEDDTDGVATMEKAPGQQNTKEPENKKKKLHKEFLKDDIKVKLLPKKALLNSFKDKLLTIKKKTAAHQIEHGGKPDYLFMMRNNIQDPNVTNASPTAGKYMIMSEGPIREHLLGGGVKFVKGESYMFANHWDMTEEVIDENKDDYEDSDEGVDEEKGAPGPGKKAIGSNLSDNMEYSDEEFDLDIYQMKKGARKVQTPGSFRH